MMKHLIFFLALFISVGLEAQTNDAFVQNNATALNVAAQGNIRSQGSSAYFVNPPREIEGSVHLFDNWNNRAVIYTVDNQQYLMKNINLNLQRHTFESKIAQDTLFTFNFNNIDKFVV
ncbi:MAG: hypothetical protein KJN59_06120, partial [Bacteroidia bacterium]|nr:hypothetical protein [Bacteroidia bacterium]